MTHFKSPVRYNQGPSGGLGKASEFAGLPIGMEALAKYYTFDPFAQVNVDTIPGAAEEPGQGWVATAVNTSTITASDDITPPRMQFITDAAENDGIQAQYTAASGAGDFFKLVSGKLRYFECSFLLHDANDDADTVEQCDLFFGMAKADTTLLVGSTDYIGFHKADGSGVVNFVAGKNSTTMGDQISQSTGVTLAASNAGSGSANLNSFSFVATGTQTVFVYANGNFVATVENLTQLPDDEQLAPSMAFLSGEAVVKKMDVARFVTSIEL